MTSPTAPYLVILRSDLPATERELLRHYCHELHGYDGSTVLQLRAHRIETGDARYLWLDAELPRQQGRRTLRLPHDCVFLIEGDGHAAPVPSLPPVDEELP